MGFFSLFFIFPFVVVVVFDFQYLSTGSFSSLERSPYLEDYYS